MKIKILRNIIGFIILTISMCNSFTSSANAFFLVSATVLPSCIVTATPLAFGTYVPIADTLQTNTIIIKCTLGTNYTVSLNAGTVPAATTSIRKMTGLVNTTSYLPYNLYSNAGRTQNWGNQSSDWVIGIGTGLDQTLTIYSKIPQGANVPSDTDNDTITVTVAY
ncbi:MAG: spore coat U domain-containing protein [Rickettsia conorii subsp. raoultii]|uniref:Spore coat U domain-containing protein n=3 Tax=Rickettsia conorii TaxID=781 RepID=A0ABY4TZ00_RICCR|nr:spore coat U domain-containing protein [Rickettsia conorii]APZ30137.1 late-developmental spore coat protein [Rickettsia conorii subsp. raoultii]URW77615.1 spore coat U domain-containing protein [Rickettsia conorii subsp. raoultii]